MKFSIIVPVYNKDKYVSHCLESLLAVEYPDKEIIAVNDASRDNSAVLLNAFSAKGVKIINLDKHRGIIFASNTGLSAAKGDIIVRTDADTVVNKDWLDKFSSYFRDKEVIAVGGSYDCLNDNSASAFCSWVIDRIFINLLKRKLLFNRLAGANRAIRKEVLVCLGGFGDKCDCSEDIDTFLKLKSRGKVIFDPKIVVKTHYPDNLYYLSKRHYANGLGISKNLAYFKTWIRPVWIAGFYLVFIFSISELLIFGEISPVPAALSVFYLGLLAVLSAVSLFLLPKKKFLSTFVPVVFIVQNTAYLIGIVKGFLSKKR